MRWRQRAARAASAPLDVLFAVGFWFLVLTAAWALYQIAQAELTVIRATRAGVLGLSTYGCYTTTVDQVLRQDLATDPALALNQARVTVLLNGQPAPSTPAYDVGAGADPSLQLSVQVPVTIRWLGVPITVQLTQSASVVSSAVYGQQYANASCTGPSF